MLAGIPVDAAATAELTAMVRAAGADELPERLEQALDDGVALLALTIDERAVISPLSKIRLSASPRCAASW